MSYHKAKLPPSISCLFTQDARDVPPISTHSPSQNSNSFNAYVAAGRSPLQYRRLDWRCYGPLDVANAIGVTAERYEDFENGWAQLPTLEEIHKICGFLQITPLQLYNSRAPFHPQALVEAMIQSYHHPSVIDRQRDDYREQLKYALGDIAAKENSYSPLFQLMTKYYKKGGVYIEIGGFISSLLNNDCNPNFLACDIDDYVGAKSKVLETDAQEKETRHTLIVGRLWQHRRKLFEHFGKSWVTHKHLLNDVVAEGFSKDDVKDFFVHDLPPVHSQGKRHRIETWNMYQEWLVASGDVGPSHKACQTADQLVDEFEKFYINNLRLLDAYKSRQIIASALPELCIKPVLDASSYEDYILTTYVPTIVQKKQEPIALLPPPDKMSDLKSIKTPRSTL